MSINIFEYQKDIQAKAKLANIGGMEWEDIAQELYLHLWCVRNKYNPVKSSPRTFVVRVITNKIRDLARRSLAKKRNYHQLVSLDALMERGFDIAYNPYE